MFAHSPDVPFQFPGKPKLREVCSETSSAELAELVDITCGKKAATAAPSTRAGGQGRCMAAQEARKGGVAQIELWSIEEGQKFGRVAQTQMKTT